MEKKKYGPVRLVTGLLLLLNAALFFAVHMRTADGTGPSAEEEQTEQTEQAEITGRSAVKTAGDNIRVLITDSSFQKTTHKEVTVTGAGSFWVQRGDDAHRYPAGTQMTWKAEDLADGEVYVYPDAGDGSVQVLSIERECGNPSYEGRLQLQKDGEEIVLVNILDVETYLRYVVPSEMPAGYGEEALKAQAVCARNFAWQHILDPGYPAYGAHLDDSIRCQVYNNCAPCPSTDKAIDDTSGMLLFCGDDLVQTYYFSTSWGYTTDAGLWGQEQISYCKSRSVSDTPLEEDLSQEDVFRRKLGEDGGAYEKEMGWFRWSYEISLERLTENRNLMEETAGGETAGGETVPEHSICGAKVTKRGAGGAVLQLAVQDGEEWDTIEGEQKIRQFLWPRSEVITKNDGTQEQGFEKTPSPYFYLDAVEKDGKLTGYRVIGGGCGHGLGMTQNGANALAEKGYTCEEILRYFYTDTVLQKR